LRCAAYVGNVVRRADVISNPKFSVSMSPPNAVASRNCRVSPRGILLYYRPGWEIIDDVELYFWLLADGLIICN
jgi:hypothetical protein